MEIMNVEAKITELEEKIDTIDEKTSKSLEDIQKTLKTLTDYLLPNPTFKDSVGFINHTNKELKELKEFKVKIEKLLDKSIYIIIGASIAGGAGLIKILEIIHKILI